MDDPIPDLQPSERDHVHGAVPSRVSEFATGRRCARDAMALLGRERGAVPAGPHREPVWPDGLVGSITHCTGYRGAALAVASHDIAGLGVDAEPNAPLPPGVLELVASEDERRGLARQALRSPFVAWDRMLFSAKEAVYKAWFPVTGTWLGFEEARVAFDGPHFTADLRGADVTLTGRWGTSGGLLATSVALTADLADRMRTSTAQEDVIGPGRSAARPDVPHDVR